MWGEREPRQREAPKMELQGNAAAVLVHAVVRNATGVQQYHGGVHARRDSLEADGYLRDGQSSRMREYVEGDGRTSMG